VSGDLLECVRCGRKFIWSYDEQRFYAEQHLDRPKHCPDCRSRRHRERDSGGRGLAGPPGELSASAELRWKAAQRAVLAESQQRQAGSPVRTDKQGCLSLLRRVFGPLFRRL
jgi:DNA-directed RNA polymerase subunit RPC12/RpoP